MVRAIKVAELYLSWANSNGDLITNLKMQKLLYYAQAWHLVNFGRRLFIDDLEAWEFGPVVPQLYRKWKRYGNSPIPYRNKNNEEYHFNDNQLVFLKECYKLFNRFSAFELVGMTHNEDPWKDAFRSGPNTIIEPKIMKDFYTEFYKNAQKD